MSQKSSVTTTPPNVPWLLTAYSDGAPDFRLYAGGAELGAAWRQESKDGETPYLAVKLDDPSFTGPMRAAFFENEADGTGVMVWNRAKAN